MGKNMEEYRERLIHALEIARVNRNNITSLRETNIFERLWRMHILSGKSFPKKIFETIFDMSTYFRYIYNAEKLCYGLPRYNQQDNYEDTSSPVRKKKRGRPVKNVDREYEYMQEDCSNRDYEYPTEKIYNDDDTYAGYVNLPHENFPQDGQDDFMRMRDSWGNLFRSMTKGVHNDSIINNYYENENNENYNCDNMYYNNNNSYSIEPVCAHCDAKETSLWRRIDGLTVCNACGLYYKMHGVIRPRTLKKDTIKKRRRTSKRKKGEEEEFQPI